MVRQIIIIDGSKAEEFSHHNEDFVVDISYVKGKRIVKLKSKYEYY